MADTKISADASAGTLDGTEIVPVVDGGVNKRTTAQDIADRATVTSAKLDTAFGSARGSLLHRGAAAWDDFAPGTASQLLSANGASADLTWSGISAILDAVLGSTRGAVIYRGAAGWAKLDPGTTGHFLKTLGAGADPAWASAAGASVDSAALDAAFGSTQGNILFRNATVWTVLAPGTSGQFLKTLGAAANPAWDTPPGGGSGGLYNQVMSATPTAANTGLSTWANQGGASVADSAAGIALTAPNSAGVAIRGRTKTAPTPPYTITALIGSTNNGTNVTLVGLGWYDGTKIEDIHLLQSTGYKVEVYKWNSVTAINGADAAAFLVGMPLIWLQIADDGTNVSFRFSVDGVNFLTRYTVAKASGFLGASGYGTIVFMVNAQNADTIGSLLSYAQA